VLAPDAHLDEKGPSPPEHPVRSRWGSEGRLNLIGTLCLLEGEAERLEYRVLEGSCDSEQVLLYLDALAERASPAKPCVVVLDNAPFHTAGVVRERETAWEARGLRLYRLPAYCPHLNLIEGVWRRLKGFLMPRRFYDSVAELKRAVLHALHLLRAVEVQCSLGDT
jgi:putative transposase